MNCREQGWKSRDDQEAIAGIQANNGDLVQDTSSEDEERWVYGVCVWKAESMGLSDGLYVRYKKKEPKICPLLLAQALGGW